MNYRNNYKTFEIKNIIDITNSAFMISRGLDKTEEIISELEYSCKEIIQKEIYKGRGIMYLLYITE